MACGGLVTADRNDVHLATTDERNWDRLVWLIVLIALAIRVWGNWWDYPGNYHPDEAKLVRTAVAFFEEKTIRTDFLAYPTLYTYCLTLLFTVIGSVGTALGTFAEWGGSMLAFYDACPGPLHVIARTVTALFGAGTVWLTWLLGARLFSPRTGLVAALCLTFSYTHVLASHYATTDVPATFFVLLTVLLAQRIFTGSDSGREYLYAGLFAGLAAATKYPAGLVFASIIAATIWGTSPAARLQRRSYRSLATAACAAIVGFLLACPSALVQWRDFFGALFDESIHAHTGHLGSVPGDLLGYVTHLTPAAGVGYAIAAAAFLGLLTGLFYMRRAALFIVAFPVCYYALIATSTLQTLRYITPVIPFICLFAAFFIDTLQIRLFQRQSAPSAWLFVAAMLVVTPAYMCVLADYLSLAQGDTRRAAAEWATDNVPRDETVAVSVHSRVPLHREHVCRLSETYNDIAHEQHRRLASLYRNLERVVVLRRHWKSYLHDWATYHERMARANPSVEQSRALPLSWCVQNGCKWLIIETRWRDKFYSPATVRAYPDMARSWQQFFEQVRRRGQLAYIVGPRTPPHPWGLNEMQAPGILIYRISDTPDDRARPMASDDETALQAR